MAARGPQTGDGADIRQRAEEIAAAFPPLLIEAERIAHTVAAGLHGRRRAGPGETFWQHRAYAFGDPVSTIDWRQSARVADRLYVRQNEWDAAAAVWVWRDPSRSLDYASTRGLPTKRRRADTSRQAARDPRDSVEVVEQHLEIAHVQCTVGVEITELSGERLGVENRDGTEEEDNYGSKEA